MQSFYRLKKFSLKRSAYFQPLPTATSVNILQGWYELWEHLTWQLDWIMRTFDLAIGLKHLAKEGYILDICFIKEYKIIFWW